MALLLGIDTGGTYTDAVLYDEDRGLVATAKDLTTKHDLAIGVGGAIAKALAAAKEADPAATPEKIALVSLSTTLATNAVVESQGFPVAMVMIGLKPEAVDRAGLRTALGDDVAVFVAGGHNNFGDEAQPLDEDGLRRELAALKDKVSAVAVCGYFAVRNPGHELRAREIVHETLGLPVTTTHELTSALDAPRRALTALFNARLVPLIQQLVLAVETRLEALGVAAPLMVVKGDGSLVSSETALLKPVETILSGPAASVVGAQYLSGQGDAVVSDIGGTTTDVAILAGGRPALAKEGAAIAGYRTMVEAVAVHTVGLGGDSEIRLDEAWGLTAGPRRAWPLALLALDHEALVMKSLEAQAKRSWPKQHDGRFLLRLRRLADERLASLTRKERLVWDLLEGGPQPLDRILDVHVPQVPRRLLDQGLCIVSAFTPSDACHVLGLQEGWNAAAARLGAELFARQEDFNGRPIAESGAALARRTVEVVTLQSAEAVAEAVLRETAPDHGKAEAVVPPRRVLRRMLGEEAEDAMLRFSLRLDRPVVGIGAPAATYYDAVAGRLNTGAVVPPNFDVCNAVGAVAGGVSQTVRLLISSPQQGLYRLHAGAPGSAGASGAEGETTGEERGEEKSERQGAAAGYRDFEDLDAAAAAGLAAAAAEARALAEAAGAQELRVETRRDDHIANLGGGMTVFVESRITATAFGRPRVG